MIDVPLDKIVSVHPEINTLAVIQSNLEYLLDSVAVINADYLQQFLKLHPVTIVQDQGKYYCIGNLRLFQVARTVLTSDTIITCQLLKQPNSDNIKTVAVTDFYLSLLLFPLRSHDAGEQISRLWSSLDDLKKQIMPGITQLTTLCQLFGVNRKRVYLRRTKSDNKKADKVNEK